MVMDITHLLGDEQGSAFDESSLMFTSFDEGSIFNYDTARSKDLDEMLKRDGKARTLDQALSLPLRGASRSIRRGPASRKVANFVEEQLFSTANNGGMSISMNTLVAQMTGAIIHRKAYFEKVWVERDGHVVYDKIAWRPPATCSIKRNKRNAAFEGFVQNPIRYNDVKEIHIKPERAFVHIHGRNRNPLEGISELDVAYWCYTTKQKIRFLWYSFLEGQSLPKTVVKAKTQKEADAGAKKMLALRSGGIAGITDQIEFSVLESSGKGAGQFKEALQWLDLEASGSVLAGFTDLGGAAAGGTGSFALSKDQTDFFLMSREADAAEMQDDTNQFLVADLVRWNFGPDEPCPVFEFGPIAEDDASTAISLLQATSQSTSPVLPPEFMEELIEKVAGFLNLDTARVRDGLEKAAKDAEAKAEQLGIQDPGGVAPIAGAVDAASKMVANMQNPPPPPRTNQFRAGPNTPPTAAVVPIKRRAGAK